MAGPLPNLWHTCNLQESPYFQDTLGAGAGHHPLSLFVGRAAEQDQLVTTIGGAGQGSSRQAVGGPPGVGKTTLIQAVKAAASGAGYWTTDSLVPISPQDQVEHVIGRVLAGIYDTILAARPQTRGNPAMLAAQQLVRAVRVGGGGFNVSVFGVGGGGSVSQSVANPPQGLLIDGPRLIRDLMDLVRGSKAPGLVLHLNNLENLSEAGVRTAADILRSIRDTVLLQNGLHLLLVGTTEAVLAVTQTHAQVRSVFGSPLLLGPLPMDKLMQLLDARYTHLRLRPKAAVTPPIDPAAVKALYPLFRGDLRGLLKALEEAATMLLSTVAPPIPHAQILPALVARYRAQLSTALDPARLRQLEAWGKRTPMSAQTQQVLTQLWGLSQGSVSRALADLVGQGYVLALPREGAGPITYVLTGPSRVIFG